MAERHSADLGVVQQTLLIPLYGRAVETGRRRAVLNDPKSVEMVDAIDYDFSWLDGKRSLLGTALRTSIFDGWVREFLAEHPAGTMVEVGVGLNTRYERTDNGRAHWIDLDLPDVIELRRRFFADTDRRRMVAGSVLDESWVEIVKSRPGPYFFAAEAVLVYLAEPDVRRALTMIARHFPGAYIATDTCSRWIIDHQHKHDTLRLMTAKMAWICDEPRELETWGLGLRLADSRIIAKPQPAVRAQWPLKYRAMARVLSLLRSRGIHGYKLNLYRVLEPQT